MEKTCPGCGAKLPADSVFCTECGAKAPLPTRPPLDPIRQKPPVMTAEATRKLDTDISTGYFFAMIFVYSIPIVGWLVCIISAFALKNPTKRHFAKAVFIWLIIGLVLSLISYFIVRQLMEAAVAYFNSASGAAGGDVQNLPDILQQFMALISQ